MDRDALISALPTGAQFNAKFPQERKTIAEDFIGSILDAISSDGREPDDWEGHDIAAAIGYVAAGMYGAAVAVAERALTPPEERAPLHECGTTLQDYAANPATIGQLREALDHVRLMSAKNY